MQQWVGVLVVIHWLWPLGDSSLASGDNDRVLCFATMPGCRATMDWTIQQAKAHQTIISGFHSPLEQSVLHLLLQARSPVVAVLARPMAGARLKPDWKTAMAEGRMAVVSNSTKAERLTSEQALQRNELAAHLAEHIVITYTSTGGGLARQSAVWASRGMQVHNLAHSLPADK